MNSLFKRYSVAIALLAMLAPGNAQSDTIYLRQCLKAAQEHAVINPKMQTIADLAELKIDNAKAGNLPSLQAYGKAWYQSDAIAITIPGGMGIEVEPFQYNAGVEATQKLYDGGMAGKVKQLEQSARSAEISKVEANLYQLNTQVSDLFFTAMLLNRQLSILKLQEEVLLKQIQNLQTALEHGVVKQNDLEKMQAEQLTVQQQLINIEVKRRQVLVSINMLCNTNIADGQTTLLVDSIFYVPEKMRPEHTLFESETTKLESLAKLQKSKNYPKLYAYSQAGYSYPGLNFYENQPDYFYIVGAKLSWTLFDWKQNAREIKIIRKQKELVEVQRTEFNQKIDIARQKEQLEQEKLQAMISIDTDIIEQRAAVVQGSESALENGTITTSDYLKDLNQEIQARLAAESHSIQLQQSVLRQKILQGIDLSEL